MSDPTRLLQGGGSAPTANLLRQLKAPQAATPAVKAALGQQLSGMVAQGALPAASAAALWLKAGVVALAVAGGGVAVWKLTSTEEAPAPRAPAVATAPSIARAAPASAAPELGAIPEPVASEAPARAQPARSAPTQPRDRLAEEEAILEEARSLLASSPARALGLLQRHRARYPSGQLAAERMFLSVDCLRRLGRRTEAQREADALVARYPSSAYARRAPLLLGAPSR
jgi:hypothetical protein